MQQQKGDEVKSRDPNYVWSYHQQLFDPTALHYTLVVGIVYTRYEGLMFSPRLQIVGIIFALPSYAS